jgi:hypothetical protein
MQLGMNEIHVHLLAETKSERLTVETYLRNEFGPPLNEQGSYRRLQQVLSKPIAGQPQSKLMVSGLFLRSHTLGDAQVFGSSENSSIWNGMSLPRWR